MRNSNRQWRLKRRPEGDIKAGDLELTETPKPVPAAGEILTLDARFPTVSPYLGVGWGHKQASNGPAFFFDLGAAIGRPKVKLTATPGLVALAGQSNIDAEQAAAQDKADRFRVFPVVKLGFGYAF